MVLTIRDETATGKVINQVQLEMNAEIVTVRDIISQRVMHEVSEYNKKLPEVFTGLVEPTDAEKTLNGFRLKTPRKIDDEKQVYVALDAFQKNGYFVLINDIQSESLDQEIQLSKKPVISFIKLTPL